MRMEGVVVYNISTSSTVYTQKVITSFFEEFLPVFFFPLKPFFIFLQLLLAEAVGRGGMMAGAVHRQNLCSQVLQGRKEGRKEERGTLYRWYWTLATGDCLAVRFP